MRLGLLGALMLALTACGSDDLPDTPLGTAARTVGGLVLPGEPVPDARAVLTPEMLANSPTAVMLLVTERTDRGLTLVPLTVNRGTEQWIDANGGGILRRDGILVGTRGLGFDLLTADVAPLAAALRAGGGTNVLRVNRHLRGDDRIEVRRYFCDVRPVGGETLTFYGRNFRTTVFEESCTGEGDAFVNRYWREGDGTIRRAVERVSPETGHVELSLLVQ
ncbi:YjbF family lipoprotein [Jannaschia sp. S6380]|uniref:YjbF family lipoprotein n=1 Tax=Jannaschia sp. S6380 TaxID=2926408 RepID=UPI001FF10D02|nr:YjbF family lipoprotein [Jannaschia sp. S6380]MCK0168773.1 YjbF family lipoprotein [Jannaschia sp. S6380]